MKSSLLPIILLATGSAFADCPAGQVPGREANGNCACISVETQRAVALDAIQDRH